MNKTTPPKINCPHCGAKNTWNKENPFKPFCSERCKMVDFGAWATESRRIPGEPAIEEEPRKDDDET